MHKTHSLTPVRTLLAAAALGLLSACGGGAEERAALAEDSAARADDDIATAATAEVDLAEPDAAERDALAAANPGERRFIVTLNPAAVSDVEVRSARVLSADANNAPRSRIAAAVQALTAQTLAGHRATVHAQFTYALQGFAAGVPASDGDAFVASLAAHPAVARVELDRWVSVGQEGAAIAAAPENAAAVLAPPFNGARGQVSKTTDSGQWGLDRIDQRKMPLNGGYTSTRDGSGVTAYILDSGIKPHSDFGDRLKPGFDAIDGGDGRTDCNPVGHGTHVAGTVGGTRSGVAPGVDLVPVRIFGCSGGSMSSTIIRGMDWILANGVRPAVVNMSLGGGASPAMDEGAARLIAAGFTVVAAGGNENRNACSYSPARLAAAITVGATGNNDTRAGFSNFGSCLDLFAPGVSIRSASNTDPNGERTLQGTSMAAPHVAGAAALLLQDRDWLLPSQVATQLLSQVTPSVVKSGGSGSPNKMLFVGAAAQLAFNRPHDIHAASFTASAKNTSTKLWTAQATVSVRTDTNEPMKGVVVSVAHSASAKAISCTTGATGTCVLTVAGLKRATTGSVTFTLTGMSAEAQTYRPQANVASVVAAARP